MALHVHSVVSLHKKLVQQRRAFQQADCSVNQDLLAVLQTAVDTMSCYIMDLGRED